MKKNLLIGAGVAALLVVGLVSFPSEGTLETQYQPRTIATKAQSIHGALEYRELLLTNNYTGKVEQSDLINGRIQHQKWARKNRPKAVSLVWDEMGPDNYGGRTRTVLTDAANVNHVYTGSVSGGLFFSSNGANNWSHVPGYDGTASVSSIIQTGDGRIWVGSGNTFDSQNGGNEGSGAYGNGIYEMAGSGVSATFTLVANSNPPASQPTSSKSTWNRLAADKLQIDKFWAGGGDGLYTYTNATGFVEHTRIDAVTGSSSTFSAIGDVQISKDGNTIIVGERGTGVRTHVSHDAGATWTDVSNNSLPGIPFGGVGRIAYAISCDDANWIYAAVINGGSTLKGVYHSTDGGLNWELIGPGGAANFAPFNNGSYGQGIYDLCLTVVPGNKRKIMMGGIVMWGWEQVNASPSYGQWEQIAFNFGGQNSVHSDLHYFYWNSLNHLYVCTDGGIYKSIDQGDSYFPANRGFNVAQVYAMAYSGTGKAIGGLQDNGTFYLNFEGQTWMEGEDVFRNDGFECEISSLNPEVMFATAQTGHLGRSDDDGASFQDAANGGWYGGIINAIFNANDGNAGPFYTTIGLYDTGFDPLSKDSLIVVSNFNLNAGDTLNYSSRTLNMNLIHIATAQIDSGDTLLLPDNVQSLFAVGFDSGNGIFVTRDAMRFGVNPATWYKVLNSSDGMSGSVHCLKWSEDGDNLFVGDYGGNIFRISGFDSIYSQADFDSMATVTRILSRNGTPTDIAIHPTNPNHVVVTYGGFGGDHVFETTTAITDPATGGLGNFSSIDGNLPSSPAAPVYGAIIDRDNPNIIVIGTEYGVMATDDGGNTWTDQNGTFQAVPVFDVRQQWRGWNDGVFNPGVIYLGTHGRGIWKSSSLLSAKPIEGTLPSTATGTLPLDVYPNPIQDEGKIGFTLAQSSDVLITIYDLNGRLIQTMDLQNLPKGEQTININAGRWAAGTYVVNMQSATETRVAKIIKR